MGREVIAPPQVLRPGHRVDGFRCGQASLDQWLTDRAFRAGQHGTAVTYVACVAERVVGYYSLSAHAITRDDAGGGWLARNTPDPIPAVLLGRLAVDVGYQGQGVGWSLLRDAIGQARRGGGIVGMRALVVDPIDEAAAAFYTHFGFRRFPAATDRLFLPLGR